MQLQPDMQMVETGYNDSITRPFEKFDDVLGVSGRGCHLFRPWNGHRINWVAKWNNHLNLNFMLKEIHFLLGKLA